MRVIFYPFDAHEEAKLKYAVIVSAYQGQWVYVRHKDRETWEVPGGTREPEEPIELTASRELVEETGALTYSLSPVSIYAVEREGAERSYGALYYSDISELGPLSPDSEIGQLKLMQHLPADAELTYPAIQPFLYERVMDYLNE